MVHALERARRHLVPDGALICIQPRRIKRPFIAVTASGQRQPVAALVNPVFEPLISAAEAAIQTVIDERLLVPIGTSNHQFRIRLASPAELHRYLHVGPRPPRFPAGGRQRLRTLWRTRPEGAQIEVTEFLSIIALRATSDFVSAT
jgi:hypothetical protein